MTIAWRSLVLAALLPLSAAADDAGEIWIATGQGSITIAPDGSVEALSIGESFGGAIDAAIEQQMRSWRFEPIVEDGRAVSALAHMEFRLKAVPAERGDDLVVSIDRVSFVDPPAMRDARRDALAPKHHAPAYPSKSLRERHGAHVDLIVAIDSTGAVVDAAPAGGWLLARHVRGSDVERAMERFHQASLNAVRRWQFAPGDEDVRYLRVPISFRISGSSPWKRAYAVGVEPTPLLLAAGDRARPVGSGGAGSQRVRLLSPLQPTAPGT